MNNKRGQSTVEYVLLVAAVIAVMIVFTQGGFKTQVANTLNSVSSQMNSTSIAKMGTNTGQGGSQSKYTVDISKVGQAAQGQLFPR